MGTMRAVLFRLHGRLRHRWLSTLVVTLLVALVSGAVLALLAGARRTADAPAAFTRSLGGDPDASVTQQGGPSRVAELAALPGVRSVEPITFLFADVLDPKHQFKNGTIAFAGSRVRTARLVAGRQPGPSAPHEFVANRQFVHATHARLGQHFRLVTWSTDQAAHGLGYVADPKGPPIDGVLVGVIDSPESLQDQYTTLVFSPSLLREDIGLGQTITSVRLDPEVSRAQLRKEIDGLPGGDQFSVDPGQLVSSDVSTAIDAQARGIWLMAAVAAVGAVIALGQVLSRHAQLSAAEREPLGAVGYTRGQLAGEAMGRAAIPAAAGIVLGMVAATAVSGRFPAGFVRPIEPHPGLRIDGRVFALAGVALLLALLAWVGVALLLNRTASRKPSMLAEALARRAPGPEAATGARFALTSQVRSTATALGTFLTLGLIVAGLVGATTFARSLNRLINDRGRYGINYSFGLGELTGKSAEELTKEYEGDPDIASLMVLSGAQVRSGATTIGIVGVARVQGDLAPHVLAGRLPTGSDELALGRVTAGQLHLGVGDDIRLTGPDGVATYRIVGLAVVPPLGAIDGVGEGGVATSAGLARLAQQSETNLAAIDLRAGAPTGSAKRLGHRIGEQPGTENSPSSIVNIARIRSVPGILAALLAVLAALTLVHALLVSIQGRRRDLAVLKALGANGRWITRAVHWQASVLSAAPLVLGIPLGLLAGSVVFRSFADHVGALPDPALPLLLVVGVAAALVVVANLAALVPARRARLVPAARILRDE